MMALLGEMEVARSGVSKLLWLRATQMTSCGGRLVIYPKLPCLDKLATWS